MIFFSDFGVAAPFKIAVTHVALNTSTGNQDITVSGFGTPKAAIFIINEMVYGGSTGGHVNGSFGATDGTNQWVNSWKSVNGASPNPAKRATTTRLISLTSSTTTAVVADAHFNSWIGDGVRITIDTNTPAAAYGLLVILIGGSSVSAVAGTKTLTTQNNSVTVTPGFQLNALFVGSHQGAFDNANSTTSIASIGFASYDGSTIRQCANLYRGDAAGTSNIQGEVRTTGVATFVSSRYAELANITSTAFDLTSRGADLSAATVGYLALNFGGAAAAWAGSLNSPTATGNNDFTGPSFTPQAVFALPTMLTATDTNQTSGEAGGWGFSANTASEQGCHHWRDKDAVTTAVCKSEVSTASIHTADHAGTAAFDATYVSMLSNGIRMNFTTANGTVRKWPFLFIG